MTRRHFAIILVLCLVAAALMFYGGKKISPAPESPPIDTFLPPETVNLRPVPRRNQREIVGLPPNATSETIALIEPINEASDKWQDNFEETLRRQGGNALKDIHVKIERSLILVRDGITLNVESILVSLKNRNDEVTTFRALVDSGSGKILQTWDQPITDPVDPRGELGVKLDPRHFEN